MLSRILGGKDYVRPLRALHKRDNDRLQPETHQQTDDDREPEEDALRRGIAAARWCARSQKWTRVSEKGKRVWNAYVRRSAGPAHLC